MKEFSVLGIDLAKRSWRIHGDDCNGKKVLSKSQSPQKVLEMLINHKPCLIGMEACGSAHYYARKITEMGHTAKLMPPEYVKAYVKTNKNDTRDAEAAAEAVVRPNMRFVPVKQASHQDIQNLHRIRSRLVDNRTALGNQARGILYEYGITIPKGLGHLRTNLVKYANDRDERVSDMLREELADFYQELVEVEEKIERLKKKIEKVANDNDVCRELMKLPGVGELTATAFFAAITDPHSFKNGRCCAASLGIVPGHTATGGPNGKIYMLPITKHGNRYLRKLLIQGARTVVRTADRHNDRIRQWVQKKYEQKGFNKAAVALANKNARIMWNILAKGVSFDPSHVVEMKKAS